MNAREKKIQEHREGLIEMYESMLFDGESSFMTPVLEQALRYLKKTKVNPKKIERWVVKLEKTFKTTLK